jgi:hypothetical protein
MTPNQILEPEWLFPFEGMEIGDSFFIPTLRPAEMMYAIDCGSKRAQVKVKCYYTACEGQLGVRAWRVS